MSHPEDFGRYRLLEPIGQGGMATVYAGEHRTLHRPVAIKVLHPHLVDEGVMARRMLEEAHTIASLHHPGIVEVIDVGLTIDGRTFMVMERLAGETLGERLHRGRLSEERAVVFARQLASALAVAHAAGVIHRDLKPDNVFIVPDPDVAGGERVKVLDFGIAKRASALREKTRTGIVLGTPAYMAPEQSTDGRDVDDRADVYALGIVIYRMVTGALPFAGADTDELFAEHAFCAPPPVASKAPVSPGLARIVERCLAKRPLDRFASMDALGAALARLDCAVAATPFEEDTSVDAGLARRRAAVAAVLPSHPDEDDEPTGQVSARQDADDTDELTAVPAVSRIATGSRARAIARRRTRMLGALAAAVPLLVVLSALLIAAATRHGDKVVPRAAEGARG
ncbi:MAG: serine/threonine protein kinase, partial [Deltaproteobacteria bacterium]|nr:serine/threonine protein kinase [Deltaproteobacteria bacterium]